MGTGGGYGKAAKASVKHAKLIKRIVRNASEEGAELSVEKLQQLRRVVEKAGGKIRTEIGTTGSVRNILHSHVEGFGNKTAHRHIIHGGQ